MINIYDVSVKDECEEYKDYLEIWDQVDDCVKGEKWVKAKKGKDIEGDQYLPKPNPTDRSPENNTRYEQYKKRALFMNATGRTLSAMVGAVYSKPPVIELPPTLEYLLEDADGNGLGLNQHSRGSVEENVKKGRHGLLVDFPATDGEVTQSQVMSGEMRPYIIRYDAQDIINWKTTKYGAINKLSIVVLKETAETDVTAYSCKCEPVYRVLWLDDEGYYNVSVMRIKEDPKNSSKQITTNEETFQPTDKNGQRLTEIPFKFVGSRDNDYSIDEAPLYDLSCVNLSHYRNSADNEESSFIVGQPTLILSTEKSVSEFEDDTGGCGIRIGSRGAVFLGQGDSAELLQADPNNLPKANMEQKEEMMVQLGARLVSPSKQQTAEAARINYGAETSQLSTIVTNENQAYGDCIRWCSLFLDGNDNPDFTFELNSDFFHQAITAQELTAWMAGVQQGRITQQDFNRKLRVTGQIAEERTDEDIADDLEMSEPTMVTNG